MVQFFGTLCMIHYDSDRVFLKRIHSSGTASLLSTIHHCVDPCVSPFTLRGAKPKFCQTHAAPITLHPSCPDIFGRHGLLTPQVLAAAAFPSSTPSRQRLDQTPPWTPPRPWRPRAVRVAGSGRWAIWYKWRAPETTNGGRVEYRPQCDSLRVS